jgi:ribonuclease P protein component
MGEGRAAPPLAALGGVRFRRADRLRSGKDFRRLSREGRRSAGAHFVVLAAAGRDAGRPRLGLTVSRRVGGAVARNRVKRRVREWFRQERGRLAPGTDWVVIARRGAAELDARTTWSELEELVR